MFGEKRVKATWTSAESGLVLLCAAPFAIGGAIALLMEWVDPTPCGGNVVPKAMLTAAGCFFVFKALPHWQARSLFLVSEVRHFHPVVRLGETLELQLVLEPRYPVEGLQCEASFLSFEKCIYRAGSDTRTYEEVIEERPIALELPAVLDARVTLPMTVTVPEGIPPSWTGEHNSFINLVRVRVLAPGRPPLILDEVLDVEPRVLRCS